MIQLFSDWHDNSMVVTATAFNQPSPAQPTQTDKSKSCFKNTYTFFSTKEN